MEHINSISLTGVIDTNKTSYECDLDKLSKVVEWYNETMANIDPNYQPVKLVIAKPLDMKPETYKIIRKRIEPFFTNRKGKVKTNDMWQWYRVQFKGFSYYSYQYVGKVFRQMMKEKAEAGQANYINKQSWILL